MPPSFSSTSETSIAEPDTFTGGVQLFLPVLTFNVAEVDSSITLLIDYVAHFPSLDFVITGYPAVPMPDIWISYPVVDITLTADPIVVAPGIVLRFPTVTIDLTASPIVAAPGIALHMPSLDFTVDAPAPTIGGPLLAMPVIVFDLTWPQIKLSAGATIDFNALHFVASGTAISEVAISQAGPLQVLRAAVPTFELLVFPVRTAIGNAITLPSLDFALTADAVEAISRPRAVTLLAIAS